jgi:putative membrane protein
VFGIWWLVWAYRPWHFGDWVLENVLTVAFVALLWATRNVFRLSNVSYTVLFAFLCFHTVGAHYTYADVPYETWFGVFGIPIQDWLGFERNHFDRLVHYLFGFLFAYPMREFFMRIAGNRGAWSYYLPVELVMALSMLYELIEWLASVVVGGELGMAYLGTQGDPWDAHKDMGLATLGACLGMCFVAAINAFHQRDFANEFVASLRIKIATPLGEVKLREYRDARNTPGSGDSE